MSWYCCWPLRSPCYQSGHLLSICYTFKGDPTLPGTLYSTWMRQMSKSLCRVLQMWKNTYDHKNFSSGGGIWMLDLMWFREHQILRGLLIQLEQFSALEIYKNFIIQEKDWKNLFKKLKISKKFEADPIGAFVDNVAQVRSFCTKQR